MTQDNYKNFKNLKLDFLVRFLQPISTALTVCETMTCTSLFSTTAQANFWISKILKICTVAHIYVMGGWPRSSPE